MAESRCPGESVSPGGGGEIPMEPPANTRRPTRAAHEVGGALQDDGGEVVRFNLLKQLVCAASRPPARRPTCARCAPSASSSSNTFLEGREEKWGAHVAALGCAAGEGARVGGPGASSRKRTPKP